MADRKPTFEIRDAVGGQFYVLEVSPNGEILNASEEFTRKETARDNAIAAGADPDQIVDKTASGTDVGAE